MRANVIFIFLLSMCSLCFSTECNPGLLENEDFPGTDILYLYSPDAEHCQYLCTQHPFCQFFSFVRPDWTRDNRHFYCYLKSTPSGEPIKQGARLGVTSGFSLKPCNPAQQPCLSKVYKNVNFPGADYRQFFTVDYESCQRACTHDPSCSFFSFFNNVFTPENTRYKCSLKFSWTMPSIPSVDAKAGVVSGFSHKIQISQNFDTACKGELFQNTSIPGSHLLALPAASAEHCKALCSAHPSCTYFAFISNNFTCNLKNNVHEMVTKFTAGTTSGLPEHLCRQNNSWVNVALEGVDFEGSDIRFELMDNAETCQETCTNDAQCQFFSYVSETYHNPGLRHRCYLKRGITIPAPPEVTKLDNVVSGFTLRNC